MNNYLFINPEYFYLLIIPVVYSIWYFFKRKNINSEILFSNLGSLNKTKTLKNRLRDLPQIFKIVAICLLIIALARPQSSTNWEESTTEGIDIVLSMDISGSMLAEDLKPNRLEASKDVAVDFISKRVNDRIGLVIFSGESFTQCPLTTDHNVLINLFKDVKSGMVEDGTAIGMGLSTAVNRLKDSEAISKVIILLTDGVNNSGFIDPRIAAELAAEYEIKTYTIGLGSNGRALAPVSILPNGEFQFSLTNVEIDEDLLRNISDRTSGRYFRATDNLELANIYEEINKLEKTEINETVYTNYDEKYRLYSIIALIFLSIEVISRKTIYKSFI